MSNKKVIIILSIFLISFFSTGLRAASEGAEPTYSVSGYVTDNYGFKLVNVLVKAISTENAAIGEKTTLTDGQGYYLITGLPNSSYNFSYTKDGFRPSYLNNVIINGADVTNPNVALSDIESPTITIASPTDGQTFTTSSITVNGTASDNVDVSKVEVKVGAAGSWQTATGTTSWSTGVTLSEGSNTITARATDTSGNTKEASINITIDTTSPTVTITSTATSPTKNSPIPMTATFSETVNGFSLSDIAVVNGAASNFVAVSGTVYTFDVTPSGQGTVTVDIPAGAAQDAAGNGNTAATQFSIVYDSIQPAVTIASPLNNAFLNTSTIAVSGTASDTGSGLQKVEISVGGAFAPATVTGTSWSFTISNLSDGTHTINAKATDNAGNINQSTISISVDASLPAINITSPADGHVFTASPITVIGTASDSIGLSKVEIKVGTGDWQPASGTTSWNATVTLSEGSNTIYAQATDTSGNIQQTSITVTIVSAPSISNVQAFIISNSSIKVVWATNQSDLNIVRYGYKPALENGTWSSWNNNTSNPEIAIDGLTGQPVYYQVFSYNASNSSAYSNSSIFKFVYPLQVTMYYIEPTITNGNETWISASSGHVGKFIGVDGNLNNTGEDSLTLSITST